MKIKIWKSFEIRISKTIHFFTKNLNSEAHLFHANLQKNYLNLQFQPPQPNPLATLTPKKPLPTQKASTNQ